jgi:acyl carrier protein
MHHIVSDGWSIGVLVKEVAGLYQAYAGGKESPLPELPIQYADYAVWQRQRLQADTLDPALSYWRAQLGGAELTSLALPSDRPRPAVQSYRGAHCQFALPAALTAALRQLAQREGATLFMVLLAAFQTLLQRYSGQEEIVVGTPVAGREQPETEALIGFFVNTIVLRGDLSGNPSFTELLRRVRETTLAAYAHQQLPFEKLVEALQPQRSLSHSPLFQVMIVLQNTPAESLRLPGLTLTALPVEHYTAHFDLLLSLTETDEGISGSLQYKEDLFNASTAEQMASHYQTLLAGIAANPQERISRSPLLSEKEQKQQLEEWNSAYVDIDGVLPDVVRVIWQEILGRDALSPNANFFELGGNSEASVRMIGRLHEVLGVEVEPQMLAQHPTLETFSNILEERLIEHVEKMSEGEFLTCGEGIGASAA